MSEIRVYMRVKQDTEHFTVLSMGLRLQKDKNKKCTAGGEG